jgi:hypothetical protein
MLLDRMLAAATEIPRLLCIIARLIIILFGRFWIVGKYIMLVVHSNYVNHACLPSVSSRVVMMLLMFNVTKNRPFLNAM